MAELTHFHNEVDGEGRTTSASYTNSVTDNNPARIAGTSLSANTRYLIIARAHVKGNTTSAVYGFRVNTADDPVIALKSEHLMEPQNATRYMQYLFVHSFYTDASPADVEFQIKATGSTNEAFIKASTLHLLDLDALGTPLGTYYFDASDVGPTDSGGDWDNDSNAFNGNTANSATANNTNLPISALSGEGTTAPTSGSTIGEVYLRLTIGDTSASNPLFVDVFEDSVGGTTLLDINPLPYVTGKTTQDFRIPAPSGGWTWQKVNDLAIEFAVLGDGGGQDVYAAEVVVYGTDGRGYYEDLSYASTTEYSTSAATTVLSQLSGSDLGTDEHLILGSARYDVGSTTRWGRVSIYACDDEATAGEKAINQNEGEDTSEQRICGFAIRHKASSGTPNVTLYGQEEASSANMDDGGSYLIGIPTSTFADFEYAYTAGGIVVGSTETTVQSVGPYTPTTNGNHLIFGRAETDGDFQWVGGVHLEDGTTETRSGDNDPTYDTQLWDWTSAFDYLGTFERISISASKTYNLRGVSNDTGSAHDFFNRWLIVVNLNEAGGGAVTVALQPATATVAAQALDLSLTAKTIALTAATATVSAQALGVTRDPLSITLSPATATVAAQALDLSLTAKSIALQPATATVAAQALNVSLTPLTVALSPATATVAAQALNLTLSPFSLALTPATLTAAAQPLNLSLGAYSLTLVPATITASAQALNISLSPLSVALTPATITATAQALNLSLTPLTVALTAATATVTAQVFGVDSNNPITVALQPATITVAAQALDLNLTPLTIALTAATITAAAQTLNLSLGAYSLTLTPATITATAQPLNLSLTPYSLTLVPATITAAAQALGVDRAALSIALQPATATVAAQALNLSLTPLSVALSPATITAAAQTLDVSRGVLTVALTPATITVAAQALDLTLSPLTVALQPSTLTATAMPLGVNITGAAPPLRIFLIDMMGHW